MKRAKWILRAVVLLAIGAPSAAHAQNAGAPARAQVEQWFRDYMTALNTHNVDRVIRFYARDMVRKRSGEIVSQTAEAFRAIREWETPMKAHFDYEIVSVKGEWLTARLQESNLLYTALDVKRPMVSEYKWRNGVIVEMNLKEIRETGRVWSDARAELESWLGAKPAAQTAGLIHEGRLVFTGEGGRKLVPFLAEYRKATEAARAKNEPVMRSYIAAMNRHDVDGQYSHYAPDMHYVDGGQRITPNKEEERNDREFESGSNAKWSFVVVGAGLDSLEVIATEGMDFYDALGAGPRSHRAHYRFRDAKIVQAQAWDWTEAGRPYRGSRDRFAAWLRKERSAAAERLMDAHGLIFKKETAREMTALAREWAALPVSACRLYHPSFNSAGTRIVFSSDCEGPWGIYVALADGTLARRITPRDSDSRLPNWSPDGSKVVFQTLHGDDPRTGNWDIYTVNVDGTGLTRMTDHPRGDSSGVFSPDGSQIAFASDRGGINELFVMPATGGEARQITRDKGVFYRSVWAPDGSHILYRAATPPTEDMSQPGEFYRVRPDGSDAGAVAGGKRREANQVYSPDGKLIAFDAHEDGVTWESGTQWDVWVMNADGSGRRNLTAKNDVNDWGPAWSPDGRSIIFPSGTRNIYDIYQMNADGSNVRRLTHWTSLPAGAAAPASAGDARARVVLQAAVNALGGMEKLNSQQEWYTEGRGRENAAAEMQGLAPDKATWREHEEKIAVQRATIAASWDRRTLRNDATLRWRRMIFQADTFSFADWNAKFGAVRKRQNPEPYRRGLARRVPHVLLHEVLTRAERIESRGERRIAGAAHDVVEAFLPDAAPLTLVIARNPAVLRRVEYLAHLPGRADVTIAWEWSGWKSDAQLGHVPGAHRIDVAGMPYQEVTYTKYTAGDSVMVTEMMQVPERLLTPAMPAAPASGTQHTAAAPAAPLPATGVVAPGVLVARVGGFVVMAVEFRDFVVAFEAPEVHPGFEALGVRNPPSRVTADFIAQIEKSFPGKPLRYAVISHHHSDHMGGIRAFAAAGATIITAPSDRAAAQRFLAAPQTFAPDAWATAKRKGAVEAVADRRVITDGTRSMEVINVGKNPHTDENLFVWLPAEGILIQGDLFYYDEGGPFPPPGRETMTVYFAKWLRERKIEPRAIYGVHNNGAAGAGHVAEAAKISP